MRCSHAKRIKEKPLYENAKYLLAGLASGCEMKGFMSPWLEKNAENYFKARIPGLKIYGKTEAEKFEALQKAVKDDTYKRQMAHRRRKEGRQKAFWLKELTNDYGKDQAKVKLEEEWKKNIAAVGLNVVGTVPGEFREDIGENPDGVGQLRLMLEPLGIPVSSFSTSVDPSDYAFADIFSPDYILDSEVEKIQAENTTGKDYCQFLQERNREKIQGSQAEIVASTNKICTKSLEIAQEGEKLQKNVTAAMQLKNREKVKGILEVKCLQCHQDIGGGQTASGAPVFPFNDLNKMEALFNSPEGKYREYRQVMKERINRPKGYLGAMPVYLSTLESEDISSINMWLDSVKETP
ncbi:MAG: hypothetical protein K2P81_13345 [Bacteriovoracaceae bacterium]|nr:hypothetical protein [Bacteriovoracaceae bacterium]